MNNAPDAEAETESDELGRLTAALCEGVISRKEAQRLEQLVLGSDAAQQYFLEHMQLHGDLCWKFREVMKSDASPAVYPPRRRRLRALWRRWARTVVAAGLLALLTLGGWIAYRAASDGRRGQPPCVARLGGIAGAQWAQDGQPGSAGGRSADHPITLRAGLAELEFAGGARVILQGPAVFEAESPSCGRLRSGRLTAQVPPAAVGFTIHTPTATIVDRGTNFGVLVDARRQVEVVEVFAGSVDVRLGADPGRETPGHTLNAAQALRISRPAPQGAAQIERVSPGNWHFATSLAGSLARWRSTVAADPQLLHLYTFQGVTPAGRHRDCQGGLDLSEVAMRDGDGGGKMDYSAKGLEPPCHALRPFRAPAHGNTRGRGLQSQAVFRPPTTMTIEAVLCFDGRGPNTQGLTAAAVATRGTRDQCGFLLAAVDEGRLVHLLDGRADWLDSGLALAPGHWYYVASTFQTEDGQTVVNTYAADLSQGEHALRPLLRDRRMPGTPPAGQLGIGKGFDGEGRDAYPWPGAMELVAIYGARLDESTLQAHLEALNGPAPAGEPQP